MSKYRNVFRVLTAAIVTTFVCSVIKYLWICDEGYFCLNPRSFKQSSPNTAIEFIPSKEEIEVVGLVLARGGSKGIKKKNLVTLGNETLVGRSINVLKKFGRFSSIWVSTDDSDIAHEARAHGAQVHWRSKESATDTAPSIVGVQDFVTNHPDVDIIGLVQCTSPFITPTFLSDALDRMLKEKCDSVFSVTRKYELRWAVNEGGNVVAVNFDPHRRPRRQDWAGELVETGMFYFANITLIREGLLQGGKCCVVEVPRNHSSDINTLYDLKLAQAQLHHEFERF